MLGHSPNELADVLDSPKRIIFLVLSIIGLASVYFFQEWLDILRIVNSPVHPYLAFIVKKTLRVICNDSFMLLLIYAWFNNQKITYVAAWIQVFDTLLLLPLYFLIKLQTEGTEEISSPLLSQLHRLIINPTLLIIFIPAVYFQRFRTSYE